MPTYIETFNHALSIGVMLLQAAVLFIACAIIFFPKKNNQVLLFFKDYAFVFGFLVAFGSILLSLFYSNIIGFPPCELCWIQRVFLYPQAILLGMELYKRDRAIVDQSIVLAVLGSVTSIYHIYIEHGGASVLGCATGASAVSCATRYVYEFSYVSIPVMALSASLFILALLLNYKYMTR